ncbi:MAG: DMT family transporter [Bacillota bacterium]|nr:DMT family transporter [Bacillota bacterium]
MAKLYSALIVLSLIWGTSFLFIKILLESFDPYAVVFGRSLFGALILLMIVLVKKEKLAIKNIPKRPLLFVALMNNVIPWLFICTSETKISSGLASIINATTPIWTLVIGFFIFSAKLRKNQWVGVLVGFIGIFILSEIRPGNYFSDNLLGVVLMSCATFCYGMGSHLTKKYLANLSILEISFYTLAMSTVISFAVMLMVSPKSVPEFLHISLLWPFFGLGALGSGIAYLLYYFLVQKGGPEFSSLVTYLAPVSAILWGALLLKETIHLTMILGLGVIFLGVYISSFKMKAKSDKEAAA